MHLLPADRAGHRIIDPEKVCDAIAALGDPADVAAWAQRFALLADPTRLRLLLAIKAAGPVSVSDLAAAVGISDVTVSQTLRHLRASGTVTTERDGRIIRYQLRDEIIGQLLNRVTPARETLEGAMRPTR
jgi:ArsR family transcriptional regulator, lead/cadmium/zinc/bismuth-responsive transcriptional repressor